MWKKNMSHSEKNNYERLGSLLTFWYPSMPKTYGLTFLREFLESYDAWGRFIKNYHDIPKKEGFNQYCNYVFNTKDYSNIIEWAFKWNETKEDCLYWARLNELFKEFLKEKEKSGITLTKLVSKETTKPKIELNPIYALLSGATNMMQMAEQYTAATRKFSLRKKKLGFKVPISATTIYGTSL